MTIEESIAFYEQQAKFGVKLGLDTVRDLLHRLDDPQNELTYLHVAGTNGKGSTSAFLSTILMEAGYRVGLYTSPALERFNERIQINNVPIADEAIIRQTIRIQQAVEEMKKDGANLPSQFELETALAFLCFREAEVDLVVLEVGMGGRLDATNVISKPLVSL
ncbi:folylpolyglutamate synthase/dihydrofolate synthase family protein, partial [uncultured Murdochiella sp.]|uniref:bifunctional folylpolyglutamate synthase/dihydrofolate synthase n=1 Tax=uncultured Murdochiella sp. TaxID=1586095 RepID=UPI0035A69223